MKVKVTHASGFSSPYDGEYTLDGLFTEFGYMGVEAAMESVLSQKAESNGLGLLFEAMWDPEKGFEI